MLREVSGNMASCYFWFVALFSAKAIPGLPQWPQTATALAHSLLVPADWSLTETSASAMLSL